MCKYLLSNLLAEGVMLQLVLIVKCKFLIREMSMYSSEDSSSKVRVSGSN